MANRFNSKSIVYLNPINNTTSLVCNSITLLSTAVRVYGLNVYLKGHISDVRPWPLGSWPQLLSVRLLVQVGHLWDGVWQGVFLGSRLGPYGVVNTNPGEIPILWSVLAKGLLHTVIIHRLSLSAVSKIHIAVRMVYASVVLVEFSQTTFLQLAQKLKPAACDFLAFDDAFTGVLSFSPA